MNRSGFNSPRKQRGAALYVALIFLIILALLGVTGMQVATMQERMSANYLATNTAFQRTEELARQAEAEVGASTRLEENCGGFDPAAFGVQAAIDVAAGNPEPPARVRKVEQCVGGGQVNIGEFPPSEQVFQRYRITAYRSDRAADPTSDAVVDTIFIGR